MSVASMITKTIGLIEDLREKRIPTNSDDDHHRIMKKWFPIFEELGKAAQDIPKQGAYQMKVWANPRHTKGFSSEHLRFSEDHMDDVYEDREQVVVYGITLGPGSLGNNSFNADMQLRFFSDYATMATWHKTNSHIHSERFNRLLELFVNKYAPPGTQRPEITSFAELMFTGDGTEIKIGLKQGLLFAEHWKEFIVSML